MNDWLSHRVRATPDATALVSAETGDRWDYADLDADVASLAARLAGLGVEADDHVGMLLSTRVEAVSLVHAAMRLGATLVPLNTRLTPGELAEQMETADLTTVVCGESTERLAVEAVEAVAAAVGGDDDDVSEADTTVADESTHSIPLVSLDDPQWERVASLDGANPGDVSPAEWADDDTLVLLFTSGTTGDPKAVVLTYGNVFSSAVASAFHLGVLPDDRWLVPLSLYHMGGLAPLYRSTLYGTTVVLRGEFDPGATADDISTYDVTGVSLVPTMLKRMLDSRGTLSDSLRFVLLGGAPASEELVTRCRDYHVPVCPTYGMTETASQIATARPEEAVDRLGSVGRPLFGTDVAVVDELGDPVETGELGEFVVSGPTVSPGYYDDPEATAAAFGERGLHTGDVGYRDEDGWLYVLNRKDDRIITGGENVDPGEVVDALREHPAVEEAAVVGLPDEEWGERVAALVVTSDAEVTADEVEAHCRERLAGYKLPRLVRFADELPRTASGTVERSVVRDLLAAPDRVDVADAEAEATNETDATGDADATSDRDIDPASNASDESGGDSGSQ
ncbi:O-succinylbenzoic acid--CoA ligase [Halogranum amylolyticum]|uniref:2-succinylbenzoate--CoA ligase n=1 Tax=Halogranum amylolyticum TaxID=660520 RepID=A0A1H8SS18_9EURY|nr:o-succinylbenzoate--CoA ligase [Halogranum amylolyticum]SEO81144.1 O-succinylbenzoic acid--CoA ligase [Halogranum amylolyticum]